MDTVRKKVIEQNEVSEMYTFILGGKSQKVLIEGRKKELPILLVLHGGPGTPIPMCAGGRGLFPEFTNRFIMVYWDQYGCGINNAKLDENYGIDDFVGMSIDLVREIKGLFPKNKFCVYAMSWGSILSAKLAAQIPGEIHKVLVWGQIIKNVFYNEEVLETFEKSAIPPKKLKRCKEIYKEYQEKGIEGHNMQYYTTCLRKYTEGYTNRRGDKLQIGSMVKGILTSPDYSFQDVVAMFKNGASGNKRLWEEIVKVDLRDEICHVAIPYYILQGDTDIVTSTRMVSQLAASADNPNLFVKVCERNGHMPGKNGMEEIMKAAVDFLCSD